MHIGQGLALLTMNLNHEKLEAWELKHFIFHHFSEFLRDIITNYFISISPFSKDNIGNTLTGYGLFHVFQAIGTTNVQ